MPDFAPVAASLRAAILDFDGSDPASAVLPETTIATNSELVERRAAPLLAMLAEVGVADIAGLRMLDLGCGFGAVSAYLAARGAEVTGIDPNGARLEVGRTVAAAHGLQVHLVRGRMEALDLPHGPFDIAVMNNSLCYLVEPSRRRAALIGARRALRPGGTLLIRNPNRWHPVDQFTGLPLVHLLPPAAAVRAAAAVGHRRSLSKLTSPPAARRELRAAGFMEVVQPGFGGRSRKPDALKAIARYQHFLARRAADPSPAR